MLNFIVTLKGGGGGRTFEAVMLRTIVGISYLILLQISGQTYSAKCDITTKGRRAELDVATYTCMYDI